MTIYVVTAHYPDGTSKVSQEGYTTREQAQRFCSQRYSNPVKVNEYTYIGVGEECYRDQIRYEITEVSVTDVGD